MRIRSLEAIRIGRWATTTLAFGPGLNIVFGPNEAGKSTALRAIEATLFPLANDELKALTSPRAPAQFEAAITLERDGGEGLEAIRWRRAGKLLLTESGTPLPPELQHAWLWETTRLDFRSIYALGNDRLRDQRDLLGKGNTLGRVLAEIAAGGRDIAAVQARFHVDLEKHYTPRGRNKPMLAGALSEVRAASDRIREADATRGHKAYAQAESAVSRARELLASTELLLDERRKQLRELDRLLFVPGGLAHIARLEERLRELVADAAVPPPAWAATTRALRDRRAGIDTELTRANEALADAIRALEGRPIAAPLLEVEDRIGQAVASRAFLLEAPARSAKLADQVRKATQRLEASLERMGLTDAGRPNEPGVPLSRFVPPEHARLGLAKAFTALEDAEGEERAFRKTEADANRRAEDERGSVGLLGAPIEIASLRALRTEVGEQPSPAARKTRDASLAERARELTATATRLGFPTDRPLREYRDMRVPAEETRRVLHEKFDAAAKDVRQAELRARDATQAAENAKKELDERQRALPVAAADADLEAARARRNDAWDALRLADATAAAPAVRAPLVTSYERASKALDATVDAVLRHVDAVAHIVELRRTRDARDAEATTRAQALQTAVAAERAVVAAWEALWAPLAPTGFTPPRIEHATFGREHEQLLKALDQLLLDQATFASEETGLADIRDRLRTGLLAAGVETAPDATIGALLARLDDRIDEAQRHNAALAAARTLVDKATLEANRAHDRLATATAATQIARERFREALDALALPAAARDDQEKLRAWIAEGRALVDQLREVHEAERALADEEASQAERKAQILSTVASVAERGVVIDTAAPLLAQIDALANAIARARETRSLEEAREKAEGALALRLREERDWAAQWSAHLLAIDRPELHPQSEEIERLLERLDAIAVTTRDLAHQRGQLEAQASQPIDTLRTKLAGRSKDDLEAEQATVSNELKALEARKSVALHEVIAAQTAFEALGTLGDHDTLRQDHEAAITQLTEELLETLALKGAHLLLTALSEELAHTDHRTALLARASDYLARLTGGSFVTLHADDDDAALTVTRAGDEETLGVEALSEGTRDQVFLALRLAVAQRQLTDKRLPFVLDDVLVHFDDARTTAALGAFAELAAHTQVILFTHHRHLFELARAAEIPFHAIELPAATATDPSTRLPSTEAAQDIGKPLPRQPRKPRAVVPEPPSELLAIAPEGAEALFLEQLRALGGSAGNGKLRAALGWEESVYDEVKAALVAASQVELGKGRGGSVKLLDQLPLA